jgi:GT2 family glycosyltransferase
LTARLSAVLVTYESEDCIEGALTSLRHHLPGAELVVVDNASQDRTREIVQALGGIRLVEVEENLGFGRACNLGAEHSTGTHLLFVNPDAQILSVDPDALEELLLERPFGLVGPHFLSDEAGAESGRGELRHERHWLFAYVGQTFGLLRPRELPSGPPRGRLGGASWIGAAAVLAEREEFDQLGRFDPRFFLYYEDRELSARYRDAGLPIRSTSALRIEHQGGGSSRTLDFRTVPQGWALLGWVQYLHLRHGPSVAGRAARLAVVTLRSLSLGLRLAGAASVPRAKRKGQEVEMLLDFIDKITSSPPERSREFCPDGVKHLARRSSFPHRAVRGPRSAR